MSIKKLLEARKPPATVAAWRQLTCARTVDLDGLTLVSDATRMARGTVSQLYRGVYENIESILLTTSLRQNDRVVEGGSGMGLVTMTAARRVGAANVLGFEPSRTTRNILTENLRTNGLAAVEVRPAALSDKNGELQFHADSDVLSSSAYQGDASSRVSVACVDIRDVVAEFRPTVLHLDIEGGECEVLLAAPLDGIRLVIFELHTAYIGDDAVSAIFQRLLGAGLNIMTDRSYGPVYTFMRPD